MIHPPYTVKLPQPCQQLVETRAPRSLIERVTALGNEAGERMIHANPPVPRRSRYCLTGIPANREQRDRRESLAMLLQSLQCLRTYA